MWYNEDKNPTWEWKRMQSLLQDRRRYKYWGPTRVDKYEETLSSATLADFERAEYMKNLVYSLQYLEFIQVQLDEMKLLTDVLRKQLYKSYIINAISIIECIFSHLVAVRGLQKKTEWKSEGNFEATESFMENGVEKRYVRQKQVHLQQPENENTVFFETINIVRENDLIDLPNEKFNIMHELRKLRNKIHLQALRHENDTDYLGIEISDFIKVRYMLYMILTQVISNDADKSCLDFIAPDDEEIEKYLEDNHNGDENDT